MSSNNFYRVLKVGERYAVEMGWMEDDSGLDALPDAYAKWFDNLEEAMKYAWAQYSEYGVYYEEAADGQVSD